MDEEESAKTGYGGDDSLVDGEADVTELSYSNKKRLLLEFSRDRLDVFTRLSERELYMLAGITA